MKCALCHRQLAACEVTYPIEGRDEAQGEVCADCDASLPYQLRPSVGYVPALLASIDKGAA